MNLLRCFVLVLCSLFTQEKSTQTVFVKNTSIKIDGMIEALWDNAQTNSGFIQREPEPLEKASVKTEFRSVYDKENVYFIVKSYQYKTNLVTQLGKRDQSNSNVDKITVYIDPLNDESSGYSFSVNPSNIQSDSRIYDNGRMDQDWDAIWESATQIYDDHWVAEIKIPLKSIKFQSKDSQTWGVNVGRFYKQNNEEVYWSEIDPTKGFKVSNFGKMSGFNNLKQSSELILTPSVVGTFNSKTDYDPSENRIGSMDIRYNIDQQNSVIATIKPDFAQIEADEDVINFTEYPDDLREKRPFFLEGNELYSMNDEVYYSRRMSAPDLGAKFIGSSGNFKYGVMFVKNDAESSYKDVKVKHKEHFVLPVVRYVQGKTLDLAYMNGIVNSDYELSGMLHAFNARYAPNDHIYFNTLFAKTVLKENKAFSYNQFNGGNHSIRFQTSYNFSDYSGRIRLQKKTTGFEQGMVGEWERNNATELDYSLWKVIRINGEHLRSIDLGITSYNLGTYDNSVFAMDHSLRAYFNFSNDLLGKFEIGGSLFRKKGDFRYRGFNSDTNTKRVHQDNFGYFVGEDDSYTGYNVRVRGDFSKPFAMSFFAQKREFRQSPRTDISGSIQYRPSDMLRFSFEANFNKLDGSKFVSKRIYRSFGFRTQASFSERLHLKAYNQYNTQSKDFSNNIVLSFEYLRGSFIYFAYTEIGSIDSDYDRGSVIKEYSMRERTFSIKWTHSLNL